MLANMFCKQSSLRCRLKFRARRMLCAYTKDGEDVWVTFLSRVNPNLPFDIAEMYLHTAPMLDHRAANLTINDIDFTTTALQFGKYVHERNFEDVAMAVWSYYGDDLELKSWEQLEGIRASGPATDEEIATIAKMVANSPNDAQPECGDSVLGLCPTKFPDGDVIMTLEEAVQVQRDYFNDKDAALNRKLWASFHQYGHVPPKRILQASEKKIAKKPFERSKGHLVVDRKQKNQKKQEGSGNQDHPR